jgi:hypothetical protein
MKSHHFPAHRTLTAILFGLAGVGFAASSARAAQFTTINPAYQQEIYAKGGLFNSFYSPGAFTPSGQLMARHFNTTDIVEFSLTQNSVYQGTNLHGVSATHTISNLASGAGLTRGIGANSQYLYLPTTAGLQRVDTNNWAAPAVTLVPSSSPEGLGVNTLPNGNIVWTTGSNIQEVHIYNPTTLVDSLVHTTTGSGLIDDIETSLTGLIALAGWTNNEITLLNSNGSLIQTFPVTNFPDGLAFATTASPPALYSNDNKGTITRYDFANGYNLAPTNTTVIASGGSYGDIATPGPDCAFYVSHFNGSGSHGSALFGTNWDNGTTDDFSSITRISLKDGCMVDPPVSTGMMCPPSGNLAELIASGGMIGNGDKKFKDFKYHPIGDMPDASLIDVVSITDSQGNLGIRFIGPFADLAGGGASEALLEYTVTVTDPHKLIHDVHLAANTNVLGSPGYAAITETFLPDDSVTVLEAFDIQPGQRMLTDWADLTNPVKTLHVQKDITLFSGGPRSLATISFIDQTFSQTPEPSALALGGVAAALALVRGRRERRLA